MPQGGIVNWLTALFVALTTGLSRIVAFIPDLLAAIVILLIGWGIAKVIQAVITRGLEAIGFNRLMDREGINQSLNRAGFKRNTAEVLGIIGYWFVFLFAIMAAINVLQIPALSALMATVVLYLPRIFGAVLIIIVGAWAANFLARLTRTSATTAGIGYANVLGSVVQGAVLFFTAAIALDLLGISFPFLTLAFAIILGAFALAGALAFGFGGRVYASDVLAGRELRSVFANGDMLHTDDLDGTVQSIGPTVTVVRTSKGDVAMQNSDLMHKHVTRMNKMTGEGGGGTMPRAA